jgi:hypothetical protein
VAGQAEAQQSSPSPSYLEPVSYASAQTTVSVHQEFCPLLPYSLLVVIPEERNTIWAIPVNEFHDRVLKNDVLGIGIRDVWERRNVLISDGVRNEAVRSSLHLFVFDEFVNWNYYC